MFPETDFFRRKNLMFLIVEGRYYNTSNSFPAEKDYLTLCGLRFPLERGRSLAEEEKNYRSRNKGLFQQFRNSFQEKMDANRGALCDVLKDIEEKEDVLFFLANICRPHDSPLRVLEPGRKTESRASDSAELIFPQVIGQGYAVINQRMYPLKPTEKPVFVLLNEKGYSLNPSRMSVEDAEHEFHRLLARQLELQALSDFEAAKNCQGELKKLDEKIGSFQVAAKVSRFRHCYEFGDIGYDTTLKSVYWLIPPHHNRTTGKSYKEGQSAAVLPLAKGLLGVTAKFAERKDRDSPFEISNLSHCLGFSLVGDSLEDKMHYLRTFVSVVERNGGFHE